jgi:hypothetical protein
MTNNIFTARKVFCPHKDYSSFLGGKLIVFNFCNYEFVLTKVCYDFFRLFQIILLFMKLILFLVIFCRTIRAANGQSPFWA